MIKTNGIPHRIPPPDEIDNDSEIDDTDIDMLNDIHEEKDIFRMKVLMILQHSFIFRLKYLFEGLPLDESRAKEVEDDYYLVDIFYFFW